MTTLVMALMQPAFLGWLLKATALLMLALGSTTLLRRASAGTRHVVWLSTLAAILALPVVSAWAPLHLAIVPERMIPALPQIGPAAAPIPQPAPSHTADVIELKSLSTPAPGAPRIALATNAGSSRTPVPIWVTLLLIWGAITSGFLFWLAFGVLSVRRIVRAGRPLDERPWTDPLCEIADRLDLDQVPRLIASPLAEMPFACGVLGPTVVLPLSAESWSDSRRRAVLFHELAHVKRHDLVGHTLGRVACALYWFHPLVWTAARRLRAESERACDDLVLSCGARASDYADHLLDIVISVRHQGAPATAMPMARRRELEGRVLAILDPAIRRIGPGRAQSATMFVGIGALALSVAAMAPQRAQSFVRSGQAYGKRSDSAVETMKVSGQTLGVRSVSMGPSSKPIHPLAVLSAPAATPAPTPAPTPSPSIQLTSGNNDLTSVLGAVGRIAVQEAAAALTDLPTRRTGKPEIDSARVALLLKVLRSDPDASVRKMAAWGLTEAADMPDVSEILAGTLRSDEDDDVREMAAWSLVNSRREPARRALAAALRHDANDNVRATAAWALANIGPRDEERQAIETALTSDASDNVRETAAWALGYSPRRPASSALVTALGDKSAEVRESAAWALAQTGDEDPGPQVIAAFRRETNAEVRMAELRALTFMHVDDKTVIDAALSSKDAELRARAVRMIAGAGSSWPEPRPRPRPRPMP